MNLLFLGLFSALCASQVYGHAFMSDPPGRSSAWRYGYPTARNYGDGMVGCGRVRTEECGVCGDPLGQNPGANQLGGLYGTGLIVATYQSGDRIITKTKVTANHQGWFEWSICRLNGNSPATEACFQPLISLDVSRRPSGETRPETKWELRRTDGLKEEEAEIQLPYGFTCEHCVLRYFWKAGNDWGCDDDGTCGMGRGPEQEKFYSCADIAITPNGNAPPPPPPTFRPVAPTTTRMRTTTRTPTTRRPFTTRATATTKSATTTTKPATGGANNNNVCAGAATGDIRPDPASCCKFVYCLWMGTVWEHAVEKTCPPSTGFNPQVNACDAIWKIDCGSRSTSC